MVGEQLPISATVFREGHDAVAANVVWTGPDGTPSARSPGWQLRRETSAGTRWSTPDAPGPLDVRRRGVERPVRDLAARGRGEDRRPARAPRTSPTTSRTAPCCCSRRPGSRRSRAATEPDRGRRRAPRHHAGRWPSGSPRRWRWPQVMHEHPVRELVTQVRRVHGLGGPGAGAVRLLVRVLPAVRGRGRPGPGSDAVSPPVHGTFKSVDAPAARDRRAWASTSSTCRRSTRSARSTARARTTPSAPDPDDVGSPWAIGSEEGGHDAIHPRSARSRTSTTSSPAPRNWAWRSRSTSRCSARPTTRGCTRAPGVVHHPARRHDRLRGEPAEEVPGHLPAQLRQRPQGHLRRGAAGRAPLGGARREDLPRRQPAHQAGELLALADLGGQEGAPRRALPRRGVHQVRR